MKSAATERCSSQQRQHFIYFYFPSFCCHLFKLYIGHMFDRFLASSNTKHLDEDLEIDLNACLSHGLAVFVCKSHFYDAIQTSDELKIFCLSGSKNRMPPFKWHFYDDPTLPLLTKSKRKKKTKLFYICVTFYCGKVTIVLN